MWEANNNSLRASTLHCWNKEPKKCKWPRTFRMPSSGRIRLSCATQASLNHGTLYKHTHTHIHMYVCMYTYERERLNSVSSGQFSIVLHSLLFLLWGEGVLFSWPQSFRDFSALDELAVISVNPFLSRTWQKPHSEVIHLFLSVKSDFTNVAFWKWKGESGGAAM